MINLKNFIFVFCFALALVSCDDDNNNSVNPISTEVQDLIWRYETFAEDDYSCLESMTFDFGGRQTTPYLLMKERVKIADSIHFSKELGYYCPCYDCEVMEEFRQAYHTAEQNLGFVLVDPTMMTPCEEYFERPINLALCDPVYEEIKNMTLDALDSLTNSPFVTVEEYDLIHDFLIDFFNSEFDDINYCAYAERWDNIDKNSPWKGYTSAAFISIVPALLEVRYDLLEAIILSEDNDTNALRWRNYSLLGLGRFSVNLIWNMNEKATGPYDPQGGNMAFGDAWETTWRGI